MKILVTGASGFVGSAVMRHLVAAGHDVRVMVRPGSNRQNLEDSPVEIVEGDLRDPDSLKQAVSNCFRLFHVAADYRLWVPDPDTMYAINVRGTRDLMLAAVEAGIERIVYTSSVATLKARSDGIPATEDSVATLADMTGHYKRSKFLAEEEVQHLADKQGLPVVIVNPSTPIGPFDVKPTPTGRIIVDTISNRMPAYVDTGLNIVHVDDVAEGHLLACEKGVPGERYILGGEDMSLYEILEMIDEITGTSRKRVRLPHNMVLPAAWMMEKWASISRNEPRATVDGVLMAKKQMYYSSDKAGRILGYRYRPAREAIDAAIKWFRENGYTY